MDLAQAKLTERLFTAFHAFLREAGYAARAGQIIDASFVTVPRQRMHRKEREQVNQGETPQTWQDQPAKRRQKDTDARWTKKNGRSFFGYKNHINVDKRHKLIHQYMVTDAAVHDSQCLEALLDPKNQGVQVFADSAHRSTEAEQMLCQKGYRSRIHEKAQRNRPLTKAQELANTRRSHHRARVEHAFGAMVQLRALRVLGETQQHEGRVTPPEQVDEWLPWVHIAIGNLKAFLLGTYHGVTGKYLQEYLDEFVYRFNRRFWEPELPSRLLNACMDHTPVRLVAEKG